MSYFDDCFKAVCKKILVEGISTEGYAVRARWADGSPAHTLKISNVVNTYDLQKEFPIMTLRKVPFEKCIDEILWIWQKKSNNTKDLNSHIWDAWADDEGSIGRAYGYQLAQTYQYDGHMYDQVDYLLECLTNDPMNRRMVADMYNPADLHAMALAPCCHHVNLVVVGNQLDMLVKQRSQDMAVANGWNVSQYAALLYMFARSNDYLPGKLTHVISDCHIYTRHVEGIKEMLELEAYEAPKFGLEAKGFYDYKVEDFKLKDYNYNKFKKKFEVAL